MKKTIIALLALGGIAMGVETVTINSESTGTLWTNGGTATEYVFQVVDNASIAGIGVTTNGGNLKKVTLQIEEGKSLTTSGALQLNNRAQTNFEGVITLEAGSTLNVGGIIQFNSSNGNTSYTTTGAITLGQGATISATSLDFVSGQTTQSLTITGTFDAEKLAGLTASTYGEGTSVVTNLITLTGGVKNLGVEQMTFSDIAALEALGYTNVGVVNAASLVTRGTYGLVYSNTGFQLMAVSVPEPTTATLSLLALAGLAARRRRR